MIGGFGNNKSDQMDKILPYWNEYIGADSIAKMKQKDKRHLDFHQGMVDHLLRKATKKD